jgi:tRNA nucleotidyltransferase (CCA-adding enzyme)
LHSLSFVDDPTRILRAARFETRLGFKIDQRSEALIDEAIPLLNRVTGGRIRHEIDLILQESRPEAALARLQSFGALSQIDPELICDDWLCQRFRDARMHMKYEVWDLDENDMQFLYWAALLHRVSASGLARTTERLSLPRRIVKTVQGVLRLKDNIYLISHKAKTSETVALLELVPVDVMAVMWLCAETPSVKDILEKYVRVWRYKKPFINGDDLKAMGFKPGPIYRDILNTLKVAHLEGKIKTKSEEIKLIRNEFNPG